MIYHVREDEKKVVSGLLNQLEGLENDVKSLEDVYKKLKGKVSVESDNSQLLKLMKKGRLNFTDGKVVYKLNVEIGKEVNEEFIIKHEKIEDEDFLVSTFVSNNKLEENGKTYIEVKEPLRALNLTNVLNSLMFKLSEVTSKVAMVYETDAEVLRDLEQIKENLRWKGDLTDKEVQDAVLSLDNLEVVLNVAKTSGVESKLNIGVIGEGFKKYRSEKLIAESSYIYKKEKDETEEVEDVESKEEEIRIKDSIKIVKGEDGAFYYELRLTRIDKNNKGEEFIHEVFERREVGKFGYERLVRDMIPVYVATVQSRLQVNMK